MSTIHEGTHKSIEPKVHDLHSCAHKESIYAMQNLRNHQIGNILFKHQGRHFSSPCRTIIFLLIFPTHWMHFGCQFLITCTSFWACEYIISIFSHTKPQIHFDTSLIWSGSHSNSSLKMIPQNYFPNNYCSIYSFKNVRHWPHLVCISSTIIS